MVSYILVCYMMSINVVHGLEDYWINTVFAQPALGCRDGWCGTLEQNMIYINDIKTSELQ